MNKQLIQIVTITFILAVLVSSSFGFTTGNKTIGSAVTLNEAEVAARYYIKEFSDQFKTWSDATIAEPVIYYNANGDRTAYEFLVEREWGNVGYIIISATEDYGPVREAGTGKPPSSYLDWAKESAIERGFISKEQSEEPKFLYWCGLSSSVQFGELMKNEGIAIHLSTGTIEQVPEDVILQVDKNKAKARWQNIKALKQGQAPNKEQSTGGKTIKNIARISEYIQMSVDIMLQDGSNSRRQFWREMVMTIPGQRLEREGTRETTVTISGVPDYWQRTNPLHGDAGGGQTAWPSCSGSGVDPWVAWDGCSPIAASNVLGYWRDYDDDYSDIPEDYDTLIDDLHHYMQTSDAGATQVSLIDNGIELTFDYYGYDFDASNDSSVSWNDIKYQVSLNQPAVLSVIGGELYNNHSITAYGYWEFDEDLIIHRKGSASGTYFLEYGDWTSAYLTRVEEN